MGDMPMGDASSVPPMPQDTPAPGPQDMPKDPMDGDNEMPGSDNPKIQDIIDNLNKLGDKGVDTAGKYVQSLVDTSGDNESENDMPMDSLSPDAPAPMAEHFIFSKKQIREMHEAGMPVQGELEKDEPKRTDKKKGAVRKKEFDAPKFDVNENNYGISNHMNVGAEKFPGKDGEEEVLKETDITIESNGNLIRRGHRIYFRGENGYYMVPNRDGEFNVYDDGEYEGKYCGSLRHLESLPNGSAALDDVLSGL